VCFSAIWRPAFKTKTSTTSIHHPSIYAPGGRQCLQNSIVSLLLHLALLSSPVWSDPNQIIKVQIRIFRSMIDDFCSVVELLMLNKYPFKETQQVVVQDPKGDRTIQYTEQNQNEVK
jgi:hypothetical protein